MIVKIKNQKQKPIVCICFENKRHENTLANDLDLPSSQPIPYLSDLPMTSYVETVTIKSTTTTTTIIMNDPLCGKDLCDDIDRVRIDLKENI